MQGGRGGGAAKSGARGRSKVQEAAEAKPVCGRRSTRSVRSGARDASADVLSEEEDDMLKAPAAGKVNSRSPDPRGYLGNKEAHLLSLMFAWHWYAHALAAC